MKIKRISTVILLILSISIVGIIIFNMINKYNTIDSQLIRITNERIPDGGEVSINLSEVITEFEWDTVSIYHGSGMRWMGTSELPGIDYHSESNGIVFKNGGQVVKENPSQSTFFDETAKVTYWVRNNGETRINYVTYSREDAIVTIEKQNGKNSKYKIIATIDQ